MADLSALAADAARLISQPELHGAVCGLAAGGAGAAAQDDLLGHLVQLFGSEALADGHSLDAFVQASVAALFAEDLRFQPLLPDDAAPIAARVQAIADWCGAFAAGYAAAAATLDDGAAQTTGKGAAQARHPAEEAEDAEQSAELLRDFVSISGAMLDGEDGEEAEAALVELREYAKVGALLLASGVGQAEGHGRN